ncbi:MAG: hypothetical protein ABID09_04120 [Candidatus Omnitrophota bacterium]
MKKRNLIVLVAVTTAMIALAILFISLASFRGYLGEDVYKDLKSGIWRSRYHRETVSDQTFEIAKKICKERGWSWGRVRTHGFDGSLAVFHPWRKGGEERFLVDGKTGGIASEYRIIDIDRNGIEKSVVIEYNYENGQKSALFSYKEGIPHGPRMRYYENGKIAKQQSFKEGKLHGTESIYDSDGKLIKRVHWENGQEISR